MKSILLQADISVLRFINQLSGNPGVDFFMDLISSAMFWIIVFAIFALVLLIKKRYRDIRNLILVGAAMGITDQISFEVIKPLVKRERPCWEVDNIRRYEDHCGGSYGFTSNHAANAGVAAVLIWAYFGNALGLLAVFSASMVGFSRVYLGVHYPGDVLGGYALGVVVGFSILLIWNLLTAGYIKQKRRLV